MEKLFVNIIFLVFPIFIFGQNLVPNGSFEEYYWCPYQTNDDNAFYIESSKYWNNPTLGTSDYFNACSIQFDSSLGRYLFSVPENYIGYQTARTGLAYGGFLYTQGNDSSIDWLEQTYSEYIQVRLNQSLESGQFYRLKFFVSNAYEDICGNSVGALLTDSELHLSSDKIIQTTPQVQSDLSVFFCDSTEWFEINQLFIASGGEQYLIIGVFTPLYLMQMSDYNGSIISGPGMYGANQYLYIDDVSLLKAELNLPNVFTPNGDGVNDLLIFDPIESFISEIRILNRWGEVVYSSDNNFQWNGKLSDGSESSDGVYFYLITTKNQSQLQGFVSLMR